MHQRTSNTVGPGLLCALLVMASCSDAPGDEVASTSGSLEAEGADPRGAGPAAPGADWERACPVGELVGDQALAEEPALAREPAPVRDPHFRAPVEPPRFEGRWHVVGPPTTPRRPVPEHVVEALEEYQHRARSLGAAEAAELKARLLGER